jgi:hypothetical protein
MHPVRKLLEWLPEMDFALFGHGFLRHGRDYFWHIQVCMGADPGEHEIVFTHCVQAACETRVGDRIWPNSWDDVFLDYQRWESDGNPDGYVWGTNWSNAYPGISIVEDSAAAATWTHRIGKPFHEVNLETDRFLIRLIFHGIRHRKISESTATISAAIIPLK